MEVNFDKQIDTILRDLAKENFAAESPPLVHLDADELSAFAENVLPEQARLRVMGHLADCSNCRKKLLIFASLADDGAAEPVKTFVATPVIPWYRRVFALPKISYAMGALALMLTGAITIILWQGNRDIQNMVAKNEPSPELAPKLSPGGPSDKSESDSVVETTSETNSTSAVNTVAPATNTTNYAANAPANTALPRAATNLATEPLRPLPTPSMSATTAPSPSGGMAMTDKSTNEGEPKVNSKADYPAKKGAGAGGFTTDGVTAPAEKSVSEDAGAMSQNQVQTQNRAPNQIIAPDGESRRSAPPAPAPIRRAEEAKTDESISSDVAKPKSAAPKPTPKPDRRNVGGKTFTRGSDGAWTDSAYRGGGTTTVKRGSDDYKKLDSSVRSIADQLGGTVIVVANGKNYRIQ